MSGVQRTPRVLSIAGSDASGGAGIQADLKSIAANGGYGMAAITALTAQNTLGVRSVHVPPAEFLVEQLEAISDDIETDAVKLGMLANAEVTRAVTAWLARTSPPVVVLDPVMVATSGDRLLDADAEAALRDLIPLAHLVTPNLQELAVLARDSPAETWPGALDQAARVSAEYGVLVLAKGGHLAGPDAPDALVDARAETDGDASSDARGAASARITEFAGTRIETTATHGTGCSLSSAITTRRAAGESWVDAVAATRAWLRESLRAGESLAVGTGHGPISHFDGLWSRGGLETAPSPAEIAADWWADIAEVRDAIDELPFVRGLADGTLDRDVFLGYLAQDALYLRDYSRVLAAASQLAPDTTGQAFWANSAHGSLVGELELHTSWLSDLDPAALTETLPDAATTAYLNHLLASSARGDYGVLVAAVLPCFWIYVDLGERLAAGEFGEQALDPEHPYASWLATYADPAFAIATREAIELVTRTAAAATPAERREMQRAFRAAAEHELAFFAAPMARAGSGATG